MIFFIFLGVAIVVVSLIVSYFSSGGESSSDTTAVDSTIFSNSPSLDRTTSMAFDFEDRYSRKLENTEDKISYCLDELTGDRKKDEIIYQKAMAMCKEYADWCLSCGEQGRAYYECDVHKIESDLKSKYETFLSACKKADSLSVEYGFCVPYNEAEYISTTDSSLLSAYFYDYHHKEIDKKLNAIVTLSSNIVDNPSTSLKHLENALKKCSEFKEWCCSSIGGKAYYVSRGCSIPETVQKSYSEYLEHYSEYETRYKEILARKKQLAAIKKSVIKLLESNDGHYARVDIIKQLSKYSKEDIMKVINSEIESGSLVSSKNGNRIFIGLPESK